jgi:4-hydroxybenzoate polyprenyltransferase
MKDSAKAWLRFFRAHTAILEAPIAVVGAALAIGTLWDIRVAGWAGFGILYHFAGYGMNSYVDWAKGFDKGDPHKEHHPLNTGEIKPDHAKYAVVVSLIALVAVGEVLSGFSMVGHICIAVMLVSGSAYNMLGKVTRFKFIPIALVHTMVFVFPYAVYSDTIAVEAIIISVAFYVHHVYQIMISGDVKDIMQDEASLLKELGTRVKDVPIEGVMFDAGINVQLIAYTLSIIEIALATSANFIQQGLTLTLAPVVVVGAWMLYESDQVIKDGPYKRSERLQSMSRKELAGIWMICAAAMPTLSPLAWGTVIAGSLAYFFPMSKFLWGNWVKPEV